MKMNGKYYLIVLNIYFYLLRMTLNTNNIHQDKLRETPLGAGEALIFVFSTSSVFWTMDSYFYFAVVLQIVWLIR